MATRREFVAGAAALAAADAAGRAFGESGAAGVSLRKAGAAKGLPVGSAVAVERLKSDPAYAALVRSQAGIVVAENSFKFGPLRPTMETYNFAAADELADFAATNGMKLRGHNFVWHEALPGWFGAKVTRKNARKVLVEHIERVGGRYAGKVHSWDVVNEAIAVDDGLAGGMRDSPWQRLLPGDGFGSSAGTVPEYIDLAFRTARRVDPKAMLCYNDFGIEGEDEASEKKRAGVLGLLRGMQARGVPVDALGVQSHIDAGGPEYGEGLAGLLATVRRMGLKVLVTELDVNDKRLAAEVKARDAGVAETYGSYLKTVLAEPAVVAVLTWGITDKYTWLNQEDGRADKLAERPLPFDTEMKAKAAVDAMAKAIEGRG